MLRCVLNIVGVLGSIIPFLSHPQYTDDSKDKRVLNFLPFQLLIADGLFSLSFHSNSYFS